MPDRRTRTIDHRRAFARFTGWMCLVAPAAVDGADPGAAGPAVPPCRTGGLRAQRRTRPLAAAAQPERRRLRRAELRQLAGDGDRPSYSGGLHGNSALALPIIILFSAWLVGIRTMLLLGGATIAVLFGYAFLGNARAASGPRRHADPAAGFHHVRDRPDGHCPGLLRYAHPGPTDGRAGDFSRRAAKRWPRWPDGKKNSA
ncbi:MAG: hypothetical protein M5R42_03415 [Rhodocyclaceae bacterium]|nr:hypothetical protein [Rhodocyclaceae bacterium]